MWNGEIKFETAVDRMLREEREADYLNLMRTKEAEKKEAEYKETIRLLKKANRLGKTVKEVKEEEEKKKAERYIKAKIKRYEKEIIELEKELERKKKWLAENK